MTHEQPALPSFAEQAQADRPASPAQQGAPAPNRKHTWQRWTVGLLVLALLATGAAWWLRHASASAPAAPQSTTPAIAVGQSANGTMNIYVDALGTVTPRNTVTLYSQITGRVTEVLYREGQMVKRGDPLVEIDPRPYQAALGRSLGILKHDQGLLAEARIDAARYRDAFAHNAIARQQVEDQEQLVTQYEGTVQADQAAVEADRVQLSYCHIAAPMAGRVGLRLVDPGNTVFSGLSSPLVVITELQPITVVFSVSEDDLPKVQSQLAGNRTLRVDAFDRSNDHLLDTGSLTSLNNQIDTATGTVKFRATFDNARGQLFPNQFVNARLLVSTLGNAVLVPSAAIQHNGTEAFVYAVGTKSGGNAPTVSVHPVTVVANDDTHSAVEGMGPGLSIVTSGFDRIENGSAVTLRNGPGGATQTEGKTGTQIP